MRVKLKVTYGPPGKGGFEVIFDDPKYTCFGAGQELYSILYEEWDDMPERLRQLFNEVYARHGYEALEAGIPVELSLRDLKQIDPDIECVRRSRVIRV